MKTVRVYKMIHTLQYWKYSKGFTILNNLSAFVYYLKFPLSLCNSWESSASEAYYGERLKNIFILPLILLSVRRIKKLLDLIVRYQIWSF